MGTGIKAAEAVSIEARTIVLARHRVTSSHEPGALNTVSRLENPARLRPSPATPIK
jgi:hypothetical protein